MRVIVFDKPIDYYRYRFLCAMIILLGAMGHFLILNNFILGGAR